ncbi:MAG: hypothetical protein MUC31_06780, partial [Bacteroidales bacterium]|nr:hypothetical protein [Bacteroidales bacterium]
MKNGYLILPVTKFLPVILAALSVLIFYACSGPKKEAAAKKERPESFVNHPQWSRNATIYEVNIRQFTPEGT